MKHKRLLMPFVVFVMAMLMVMGACKKKEGVDFKVTLQTSPEEFLITLADNREDTAFIEVLRLSDSLAGTDTGDFFSIFERATVLYNPQIKTGSFFLAGLEGKIDAATANSEVMKALRSAYADAVKRTSEVLDKRLDDYELYDYKVSLSDTLGLIHVELEGVKDTGRVMRVLLAQARMEFWETYEFSDLYSMLNKADQTLKTINDEAEMKRKSAEIQNDSVIADTLSTGNDDKPSYSKEHPLFAKLKLALIQDEQGKYSPEQGPCVGYCKVKDTARLFDILDIPAIKIIFPADLVFVFSVRPVDDDPDKMQLVALKKDPGGKPALSGSFIDDASVSMSQTNMPEVQIEMNEEGAVRWKDITASNIQKSIGIVLDGYAYSWPRVMSEIPGGKSMISGNFTLEEATDLALILKAGMLPLQVKERQ